MEDTTDIGANSKHNVKAANHKIERQYLLQSAITNIDKLKAIFSPLNLNTIKVINL